jgi:cytochrome b subunit of formate dehydrogenase
MDDAVTKPGASSLTDESGIRLSSRDEPPRTDVGTLILHWATAIALIVSLLTGIRIAADDFVAPVSKWLSPILPQGEIWSWHFLGGLVLFFCGSAYVAYLMRSGLSQRNSLKKTRVLTMPAPAKMKWGAVNVALHWFVYALVVFLTVTGIILYLGYGNWWVYLHSVAAFIGLAYIFAHVVSHYLYGGWWQVFRVFRPARLTITRAVRPKPILIALGVGAGFAGLVAASDWATRDTLVMGRVNVAPKLEALLDDPVWSRARPVFIQTQQGANLGGTGESLVEVRAVQDGQKAYFAFRWEDPTRSLRRVPIIKREDGWHVLDIRTNRQDVVDYYEDKLAIIFSDNPSLGGAGSTFLGSHPLPDDKPRPINERGFHYTTDGSYMDMWQWKASRGGMLGRVDSQYFGPPYEPSKDETNYDARYQAGYWNKPGRSLYSYNFKFIRKDADPNAPATIIRLPKDWKAQVAALGKYDLDPNSSDDENGRWYMFQDESEPYTPEADAKIPVGTVLPGVIINGDNDGERADVIGRAKWKDGHWTLITARDLKISSKYGKNFVSGQPLYMWVAVFDHTQTRHTVHSRPVRVVVQE